MCSILSIKHQHVISLKGKIKKLDYNSLHSGFLFMMTKKLDEGHRYYFMLILPTSEHNLFVCFKKLDFTIRPRDMLKLNSLNLKEVCTSLDLIQLCYDTLWLV